MAQFDQQDSFRHLALNSEKVFFITLADSKVYQVCWLSIVISKNDFGFHVFELRQRISFLVIVMVLVACCCFGILLHCRVGKKL